MPRKSERRQDWSPSGERPPDPGLWKQIDNPEYVQDRYGPEVLRAAQTVVDFGARTPLAYMGIGMTGIVLCDRDMVAWKVARDQKPIDVHLFTEEFEFLRDAGMTEIRKYVVPVRRLHLDPLAVERTCILGAAGGWDHGRELHEIHRMIERVMIPHGWTAPEFKENSYVYPESGGNPVLVDASMSQRVGENLVRYIEDALSGAREVWEDFGTLAFMLRREVHQKTVAPETAEPILLELSRLA